MKIFRDGSKDKHHKHFDLDKAFLAWLENVAIKFASFFHFVSSLANKISPNMRFPTVAF